MLEKKEKQEIIPDSELPCLVIDNDPPTAINNRVFIMKPLRGNPEGCRCVIVYSDWPIEIGSSLVVDQEKKNYVKCEGSVTLRNPSSHLLSSPDKNRTRGLPENEIRNMDLQLKWPEFGIFNNLKEKKEVEERKMEEVERDNLGYIHSQSTRDSYPIDLVTYETGNIDHNGNSTTRVVECACGDFRYRRKDAGEHCKHICEFLSCPEGAKALRQSEGLHVGINTVFKAMEELDGGN